MAAESPVVTRLAPQELAALAHQLEVMQTRTALGGVYNALGRAYAELKLAELWTAQDEVPF